MKSFLLKISLIFTVCLLILPGIGKELHNYQHKDDFHCVNNFESHYHELRHFCGLCNFIIPTHLPFQTLIGFHTNQKFQRVIFCYCVAELIPGSKHNIQLRAPPFA
ncbi:MAG: hypothetical protein A3H98_04910 [Bacteroidetes bacterium RIFCSPLOWO2_02_FULL_36_8]|nr:MAG: hypothetical protein A3H98_04910 [Bacteroidetes bacterium RIFCSPLOWO2_02_FULL_36_8]OFY72019.1 MAG: hypothetical protein A3G23_00290 [Bacteroidetes bacterium RIFCSPLOWO2_12_FULL_37_12]